MPRNPNKSALTSSFSTTWKTLSSAKASPRLARGEFTVYTATPHEPNAIRGGIVLIQEIFGVNSHIRSLAERYASQGFVCWAPAFFDHMERGVELAYDTDDFKRGRELVTELGWDQAVEDVRITAEALREELRKLTSGTPGPESEGSTGVGGSPLHETSEARIHNKVAAIGFCWGGAVAWLTATRASDAIDAAVSYYGRAIWEFRNEKPKKPVLLHYGAHDVSIPLAQIEDVKSLHHDVPIYTYDAGHGFNCDARKDFNAEASQLAQKRTLEFLTKYI